MICNGIVDDNTFVPSDVFDVSNLDDDDDDDDDDNSDNNVNDNDKRPIFWRLGISVCFPYYSKRQFFNDNDNFDYNYSRRHFSFPLKN